MKQIMVVNFSIKSQHLIKGWRSNRRISFKPLCKPLKKTIVTSLTMQVSKPWLNFSSSGMRPQVIFSNHNQHTLAKHQLARLKAPSPFPMWKSCVVLFHTWKLSSMILGNSAMTILSEFDCFIYFCMTQHCTKNDHCLHEFGQKFVHVVFLLIVVEINWSQKNVNLKVHRLLNDQTHILKVWAQIMVSLESKIDYQNGQFSFFRAKETTWILFR
jgi:hypothetical protein